MTVTIFIDGRPHEVEDGQSLLRACLSLGFDIPYFCWHPALDSVGACRLCAVKLFRDEGDSRGHIAMSCMTPARDGLRLSIDDPEAREFRGRVIEWLMVNHPHDCPVCDEGGECHLQDMTVMTGHIYRRYRFKKRTYRNQHLGPFINHEMNRCIQCYRCVRFYRDYAGGHDLDVLGAHDSVYFGRHEDGILENEFSGNLVEVCPTGVFTDKTAKRHYTRKWDLQSAPSVCVHCGLGCNTLPAERYGTLRRIRNRYHGEINGYFLCDRGRFGYEFVNSRKRLRSVHVRNRETGALERVPKDRALDELAGVLYFGAPVIGIGSPRASLEANFTLRELVGEDRFFSGMSAGEHRLAACVADILKQHPAVSLREAESCDTVLVLGEDVTNTAPRLALSLRQSVLRSPKAKAEASGIPLWEDKALRSFIQEDRGPFFVASTAATRLDDVARKTYRAAPEDIARLGFAVAHAIEKGAPEVQGLEGGARALAETIAVALRGAERPLVVSGTGAGSEAVLQAALNIVLALRRSGKEAAGLLLTACECNSLGVALMSSRTLDDALKEVEEGRAEKVIILENDLFRRAGAKRVEKFFSTCTDSLVIDHTHTATVSRATAVLPAGTPMESDGTLVNNEGRAQRFFQVFVSGGDVEESWRWLRDLMVRTRRREAHEWQSLDTVIQALAGEIPAFKGVSDAAPPAGFTVQGQKIPRQPHRASGRTAVHAAVSVHEPAPPPDQDSALTFSMEGYRGVPPAPLIQNYWRPGWNSVQALDRYQERVGGPLRGGDPGVLLFEGRGKEVPYSEEVPGAFMPRREEIFIVPLYHIFGSEELSAEAPAIAERTAKPHVALSVSQARAMALEDDDTVLLTLPGSSLRLPVRIEPSLPEGEAGVPAGLPGLAGLELPRWGRIRKA
jgi:NADH-quinone oxidoreductase subunit G